MKLKHLLTLALMAVAGSVWADGITTPLPYTTDFSSLNPFEGGSVVNGTNVQSVLNVNNTTATAWFVNASNEHTPYTLKENEEVTVSFTAFHGWLTNGANQGVSLLNSDDVVLASYTYNLGSCNLTGVTVAGNVQSIASYNLQSKAGSKNANGLDNGKSQGYVTTAGYNPVITFTVAKSGRCTVNIKKGAASIDNTYPDNVAEGTKMDIAKIVITSGSNNGDRTICIDNLSITSVVSAAPKADYTIKYVDENGTEIKESTTGNGEVGAAPEIVAADKANVIVDDKKYVYDSDDASSQTIASDGSTVVTVRFTTINKFTYTVTSSLGGVIGSGSVFADESADVVWSKCVNVDGVWYSTEAPYGVTLTVGSPTKVVEYTADPSIAYFFEAENILSRSYGNPNGFYSGGTSAAIYTGATLTLANLAAGSYKIIVNSTVRRANEDILNVKFNDTELGTITLTSNVGGDYSIDVTIPEDGTITLTEGKSQNFCHYVDYVLVHKLATATMSVGAAGYATFCAPFEVAVPAGVTASTATLDGDVVTLTTVGATIPANTPVVLEGTLDETPVAGVAVAGTPVVGVLTGVYEDTAAPVGSYVLQNQTSGVGFYKVESVQPTVGANRAYLTAASGARFFGFGEETAIKAIDALTSGKAQIFDLQGRKLNSLQKGINVVNGVKILVK